MLPSMSSVIAFMSQVTAWTNLFDPSSSHRNETPSTGARSVERRGRSTVKQSALGLFGVTIITINVQCLRNSRFVAAKFKGLIGAG